MLEFPGRKVLEQLGAAEAAALRPLFESVVFLQHELGAAHAVEDRVRAVREAAQWRAEEERYAHPYHAAGAVLSAANSYADAVEAALWSHASAYAVLGTRLQERLVEGRGPLSTATVAELSAEPTLSVLEAALRVPVDELLAGRPEDERERARQLQERLLSGVDVAYEALADDMLDKPLNRAAAAEARLAAAAQPGFDPPWIHLLRPLLSYANGLPFAIGRFLACRS